MTDYLKASYSREHFIASYRPMKFWYRHLRQKERLLYAPSLLRPLAALRIEIKVRLGLEVTYFDFRASLTPKQRKHRDMQFLTHYAMIHAEDAENASRVERWRHDRIRRQYLAELSHIHGYFYLMPQFSHMNRDFRFKQRELTGELPEEISMYLLRWGYLMNVPPAFVELIHGTEASYAKALATDIL
jgi:hypothetical protein